MEKVARQGGATAPKINYNKLMEARLHKMVESSTAKPTLLLHSCCGPCSTAVLVRLQKYFNITVFYYNPNLYPDQEYLIRLAEQKKVIRRLNAGLKGKNETGEIFVDTPIKIKTVGFNHKEFLSLVGGMEQLPEASGRCYVCFRLRLQKTAQMAKKLGFDFFCSTLSVSPYKNAGWINRIGKELEGKFEVEFLPSDFKKKDGYKNSILFSREWELYRQDYCGCEFSLRDMNEAIMRGENYKFAD